MLVDKHIHTQFCPHGSTASMEEYVKIAIEKGIEEITFTEHAPLPIEDTVPSKDSAMREEDVYSYLKEANGLKAKYASKIKINVGFEIDYIEGHEEETRLFLEKYPETIEHSILSVHFLLLPDLSYFCIDYSLDSFKEKAEEIGYETLYGIYDKTIKKALSEPYGELTPKKIGHLNLIHKFREGYDYPYDLEWDWILTIAKANNYRLDYNYAGLDKEYYGKTYPSQEIVEKAKELGLELETGSDAHKPEEIGRHFI